jgi:hypothetical protein
LDSSEFQRRVWVDQNEVRTEHKSKNLDIEGRTHKVSTDSPLTSGWPLAPEREHDILTRIEEQSDKRLGDLNIIRNNSVENKSNLVGSEIHQGIVTSGDNAYIVHPTVGISKEKLSEIDTLSISPRGIDKKYNVETDLLKIDISSKAVERWLPSWDNRLVFVPYIQGDDRAELIRPRELKEKYENTWKYFTSPDVLKTLSNDSNERKEIHNRLAYELDVIKESRITNNNGKRDFRQPDLTDEEYEELGQKLEQNAEWLDRHEDGNKLWWYRYMRRQNIESLPQPKLLTGNQKSKNSLCFDDKGIIAPHNARVYSFAIDEDNRYSIAGVLNSSLIEYYHKHYSRIHQGKAYSYIEDFISKWPIKIPEGRAADNIEEKVEKILHLKDLKDKIPQFPDPYIVEAREGGEEFTNVTFTPESDFIGSPSIQTDLKEGYGVAIGDGQMLSENIDSEIKAEYVVESINGKEFNKNEEISIPVPLRDAIAREAVSDLNEDISERNNSSIEELEEEIDEEIFKLYGITDEDVQEHIRLYNNQHESVRSLNPKEDD